MHLLAQSYLQSKWQVAVVVQEGNSAPLLLEQPGLLPLPFQLDWQLIMLTH